MEMKRVVDSRLESYVTLRRDERVRAVDDLLQVASIKYPVSSIQPPEV